ncbi:MAG: transcriptional regulator, ArsR family, partial [Gammaproteobacteria bacterium]|nr:transcriptional regulator, ArsR family [Gammaproteobacteria bacterium]
SVSELKSGFAISQPAISQHLAALRGAGLVCERREGRFAYYRAEPQALAPLVDWVDRYRLFWPERIEKLKRVLEDMELTDQHERANAVITECELQDAPEKVRRA